MSGRKKRNADDPSVPQHPRKKVNRDSHQNIREGSSLLQTSSGSSVVKTEAEDSSALPKNIHKIIVGVDYGTTYTGISYVSTDKCDVNDIALISTWPGPMRDGETVFKVPSRIAYPFNNPALEENKWGFHVEAGMTAYSWTKLLLDNNTTATEFDDGTLNNSAGTGILRLPEFKNATEVVADFLACIYKHTMFVLEKQISANALSITPIEFWFTMPAVWSDQAQRATRDAAMKAGFASRPNDEIFMISEPEAAAIATLKKSTTNAMHVPVEPGDGILVCDCGGGTVDITSYWVKEIYPRLAFDELCTGIGGKCGSSSIDRGLYKLMSERFGRAFDTLPLRRKGPGSEFMKAFERIKRFFGHSNENRIYELPLNMTAANIDPEFFDDEERLVRLTTRDVQQLFDPVVEKILKLVKLQLDAAYHEIGQPAIKHVFLVGGFGDSEYLRQILIREVGVPKDIQVTVPENPQAAIAKGATLRGLEGVRPTTRRCRRHYGFVWNIPFRQGIDAEENSYIHMYSGEKMVRGIMEWKIGKGEKISEDTIRKSVVHHVGYGKRPGIYKVKLFSSSLDNAPERSDDSRVDHVGTINADLSCIGPSKVKTKVNHEGKEVCSVSYEMQVLLGTKEGILRFQVVVDGEILGKADIDFSEN